MAQFVDSVEESARHLLRFHELTLQERERLRSQVEGWSRARAGERPSVDHLPLVEEIAHSVAMETAPHMPLEQWDQLIEIHRAAIPLLSVVAHISDLLSAESVETLNSSTLSLDTWKPHEDDRLRADVHRLVDTLYERTPKGEARLQLRQVLAGLVHHKGCAYVVESDPKSGAMSSLPHFRGGGFAQAAS